MKKCHHCLKEQEIRIPVGRKDTCPFCGHDLHCCRNCRFHAPEAYNGCREPQAERVIENERSNFCDYFIFRETAESDPGKDSADSVQAKLASLFK
jgi:hypothetical protein